MSDGCLDVTLSDGSHGTYLYTPCLTSLPPDTPPSDNPYTAMESLNPNNILSGKTIEAGKVEEVVGQGGLMRVEGRHHLIDIHGLAVFLRRSTRCLSCRAAFCLYVTGTISAQLAAITQVKITCQKCHYTTSQTLSRPAGPPEDASAQAAATASAPPTGTGSPIPPPPLSHIHKPRHQTVIKLLKEESPAAAELLMKTQMKETCSLTSPQESSSVIPSNLPPLRPIQPIERVWLKDEGRVESSSKEEQGESAILTSQDPLLTDWCNWAGISIKPTTSSPSQLHDSGTTSSGTLAATSTTSRLSPSNLQHCATSSGSTTAHPGSFEKIQIDTFKGATVTHQHLDTLQEESGSSNGASVSSSKRVVNTAPNPNATVLSPSESLFISPATSVFTVLSATPSPLPYTIPLASSLLQHGISASDPPQLLQALDIKQKLEHDLEESLRLVRRMIHMGPDTVPSKGKKDAIMAEQADCLKPISHYGLSGDAILKNLQQSPGFSALPTDASEEGGSGRRKERGKTKAGVSNKNKHPNKNDCPKKTTKAKGGKSRKRANDGDEGGERKRKKYNQNTFPPLSAEKQVTVPPQSSPQRPQQAKTDSHIGVEQELYDMLKCSLGIGKDTANMNLQDGREWLSERLGYRSCRPSDGHQPSHLSHTLCRCCNGSHPTPDTASTLLNLKSNVETLQNARKLLEEYAARKQERKGTSTLACSALPQTPTQLITALQREKPPPVDGAVDVKDNNDTNTIPDHVLESLQRNFNHLMHKNSLKMALKSLIRKNVGRTSRSRKYVKISVGMEEEEKITGVEGGAGREGRGEGGQEEGGAASWRFHDLLSSDSDSDDGKLIIDTDP